MLSTQGEIIVKYSTSPLIRLPPFGSSPWRVSGRWEAFLWRGLMVILWILRGRGTCRMRFWEGAQRMLLRPYPNGGSGEG